MNLVLDFKQVRRLSGWSPGRLVIHKLTLLLLDIERLLGSDLLLQTGDLLFRLVHLWHELQHGPAHGTLAGPAQSHRVLLAQLLQHFDLL